MNDARFTMPAHSLRDLLLGAVVAASTDTMDPESLRAVLVRWDAEKVTAAATDRYRAVLGTIPTTMDARDGCAVHGAGEALLDAGHVKALAKVLPKYSARTAHMCAVVTFIVEDDRVRWIVTSPDASVTKTEASVPLAESPKTIPAVLGTEMIENATTAEPFGLSAVSWNPSYMADMAKLPTGRNTPARWTFQAGDKPMLGTFKARDLDGLAWDYLLMPTNPRRG